MRTSPAGWRAAPIRKFSARLSSAVAAAVPTAVDVVRAPRPCTPNSHPCAAPPCHRRRRCCAATLLLLPPPALLVRLCWWLRGEMHALLCAAATSCAHTAPCTCPAHVPLCPYV